MEPVAREIESTGRKVITAKTDVSNREQVRNLFEAAFDSFQKVHVLVNNAGIPGRNTLMDMTEEAWDKIFDVNLKGMLFCIQAAARLMMEARYGKIINIASVAGLQYAYMPRVSPNYAVSKAGIMRLTKICAKELGPYRINVNAIAPGFVETDITYRGRSLEEAKKFIEEEVKQTPIGRAGTPQDIADLALFLASENSSFITGQVIVADGGRS
jgi:3-oxoacyl-[acyl-carrier protein] reductase